MNFSPARKGIARETLSDCCADCPVASNGSAANASAHTSSEVKVRIIRLVPETQKPAGARAWDLPFYTSVTAGFNIGHTCGPIRR
jgi:hypothetical protein